MFLEKNKNEKKPVFFQKIVKNRFKKGSRFLGGRDILW